MVFPSLSLAELEERLHFRPLWELGIKGRGVTVAVLDTGLRADEKVDAAVICEKDFTGEETPRGDDAWHGTSVAKGICLVAPEAQIANFKVIPGHGQLTREMVCKAVRFCIREFPRYPIINASLYFSPDGCSETNPCTVCATVDEAVRKGILVVAAAGNLGPKPGSITCPGLAREALTVVSTWTKRETEWWNGLSALKKWWWKDFTGEFGKAYGTSFSAAWVSGGAALLKSSFPESDPREIRDAILSSADRLPHAPETSGLLQVKEAFDRIFHPARYESAKRALYVNAGNKDAQRKGSYFSHALGLTLRFIRYKFISEKRNAEATRELSEIRDWVIPGALPDYEEEIKQLLEAARTR